MYAAILSESIGGVSESMGGFLKAQGSGARLFSLLDKDASAAASSLDVIETQPIKLSPNYEPTIQFTDVQFAFPSHPTVTVLNEVTFRLTKGEFLGLTGSSGSGKSSILSLLMRFYNPSRGTISLDGFDIKDLVRYMSFRLITLAFLPIPTPLETIPQDPEWLRSQLGTVRQEPILFHASVFENVAYGKPDATRSEVIEACKCLYPEQPPHSVIQLMLIWLIVPLML